MSAPKVLVHPDAELLAAGVAARLISRLVEVLAERETASVVLTGGGSGLAALAAVAASPARDAVDWGRVDFWWGDERFLPSGDPERNETGAREALLDAIPVDPARVHVMRGPDGPDGDDADASAARYAAELAAAAAGREPAVPAFDVLMLGVGPDAHIASLFPGQEAVHEAGRTAVGVHGSPKPPPTRISLTVPAIRAAEEVWVIAAGAGKAEAVRLGLAGADPAEAPVAAARGRRATLYLLDREAASALPS
ncbi:6-phosphogluconolactonase [Actinocorallia populi]|uniref:6-phosphogluconolactonase n=1 Tax=Actinocorallia populi TaxID=2079200 RepID=UPI000D089CB5|nr:6-phosphogluconolactonase [Actinocorallia populi]